MTNCRAIVATRVERRMPVDETRTKSKMIEGEEVRFLLTRPVLDALDQWAETRSHPIPSRSEAVRRALIAHLTALGYFR